MDREVEDDFREFVQARSPALLATAYLLTGDRGHAEDLLQASLVKAHRHWRRLRSSGRPEPYIRKIMVNQHRSWWRRSHGDEVLTEQAPDLAAADATESVPERLRVWTALQQLAPGTRAVLVLRYWEDVSEADTAELLGCSVGTVKSQASRGLRRLQAVLDATGDVTPIGDQKGGSQ